MRQTRSALAVLIALLSPGLAPYQAWAQTVSASVGAANAAASVGASGAAATSLPVTAGGPVLSLGVNVTLAPVSIAPSISQPVVSLPASLPAAQAALAASRAAPLAAATASRRDATPAVSAPSALVSRRTTFASLSQTARPQGRAAATDIPAWRISNLFDGTKRSAALAAGDPVEAGQASSPRAWGLQRSAPVTETKTAVAAPAAAAPAKRLSKTALLGTLAVAAAVLLMPTIALAAAPAAAVSASGVAIAAYQPLFSSFAAAAGAVYGLFAARKKYGQAPSAGEVLASVLRYGILGGAGVYALMDLSQVFFFGMSVLGVNPLPSAAATAALAQSAFQGKFADKETTSADRVLGAFPAVAAALGLGVGLALAAPSVLMTAATTAMSITGVSAAIYSALYKPGRSPADGPSKMARGFVLQSLMTGLGLAVANPAFATPLLLLGAWGLWDVVSTAWTEAASALGDVIQSLRGRNRP